MPATEIPTEKEILKSLASLVKAVEKKQGLPIWRICVMHFGDNKIVGDWLSGKRSPTLKSLEKVRKKLTSLA
jgi:hypothetical protein